MLVLAGILLGLARCAARSNPGRRHELRHLASRKVRDVSPLLGSRNGLDTADDSMELIATKIAELVHV